MIASCADQLGTSNPMQAELCGLLKGLSIIKNQELQNVLIEGDALVIYRGVQGQSVFSSDLISIWKKIMASLKQNHSSSRYCSIIAN